MTTYKTELGKRASFPIYYVEIEGIGFFQGQAEDEIYYDYATYTTANQEIFINSAVSNRSILIKIRNTDATAWHSTPDAIITLKGKDGSGREIEEQTRIREISIADLGWGYFSSSDRIFSYLTSFKIDSALDPNLQISLRSSGKALPYRFSSTKPSFGYSEQYKPYFVALPTSLDEEIDLIDCVTHCGQLEFELVDENDFFTKLFTTAEKIGATVIESDIPLEKSGSPSGDRIAIDIISGHETKFKTGDIIYLGREIFTVDTVSTGTLFAYRANLKSERTSHSKEPIQDNNVFKHFQFLEGRRVVFYSNFDNLSETDEVIRFRGRISHISLSPDGCAWRIVADSDLGMLSRDIFYDQYIGEIDWSRFSYSPQELTILFRNFEDVTFYTIIKHKEYSVDKPVFQSTWITPDGDNVVAMKSEEGCFFFQLAPDGKPMRLIFPARGIHSFQESGIPEEIFEGRKNFRQVLVTDPLFYYGTIKDNLSFFHYILEDGITKVSTCNPIDIMLILILSTGTGTNFEKGRKNYDVLPENFAIGLPISDLDLDSFEKIRDYEFANWEMPNLIVGDEGAFNLKEWIEENILKAIGCFLYSNLEGKLCLGIFRDVNDFDTAIILDESHILEGGRSYDLALNSAIGSFHLSYNYDIKKDKFFEKALIISSLEKTRFKRSKRQSVGIEVKGLHEDYGGFRSLRERIEYLQAVYETPVPRITVELDFTQQDIDLGSVVKLNDPYMPSWFLGERGTRDAESLPATCRVTAKRFRFEDGIIELNLQWRLKGINIAPAAEFIEKMGDKWYKVSINRYTDEKHLLANKDLIAFEIGDYLTLYSNEGVRKSNNFPKIIEKLADDEFKIDSEFVDLDGNIIEPFLGDIFIFGRYIEGKVTTNMKRHAVFSDIENKTIAGTELPAMKYGI